MSYEGNTTGFTEGTGTAAADDNVTPAIGLSRSPNGNDTDNNNADFSLVAITPGGACLDPLAGVPGNGPLSQAVAAVVLLSLGAAMVWRRSAPTA